MDHGSGDRTFAFERARAALSVCACARRLAKRVKHLRSGSGPKVNVLPRQARRLQCREMVEVARNRPFCSWQGVCSLSNSTVHALMKVCRIILYFVAVSSCEELPPFCLLSSLFGESHTCGHDLPEEDQTTLFISDAVAKDNQDTSAMYSPVVMQSHMFCDV